MCLRLDFLFDLYEELVFLPNSALTSQLPDTVIFSNKLKLVILLELTVPNRGLCYSESFVAFGTKVLFLNAAQMFGSLGSSLLRLIAEVMLLIAVAIS